MDKIMSFKRFLLELALKKETKFVCIVYDDVTQKNLRKWCMDNGLDLTKTYGGNSQKPEDFEFHTTIFFSTTKHQMENSISNLTTPSAVEPVKFELLGKEKNIPVLKVSSKRLNSIRQHFKDVFEMDDEWPTYKPHISLTYNRDISVDINKLQLPSFELTFDKLKVDTADS